MFRNAATRTCLQETGLVLFLSIGLTFRGVHRCYIAFLCPA